MTTGSGRPVVAAFDFDITMTTRDTFVPFLESAFGRSRVRLAFLRLTPEALKVAACLSDRDRFKEKIVEALFLGESVERLRDAGKAHAAAIEVLFRPAALRRVEWHRERGHRIVMVSASLDLYLTPVAEKLAEIFPTVIGGTDRHLVLDVTLEVPTCHRADKVRLLESWQLDLSGVELHPYGDSAGDRELLAIADHQHYRAFERGGELI